MGKTTTAVNLGTGLEVLHYHTLGVPKYQELGIPYRLEGVESPTPDRIENAKKILGAI